MFHKTQSLITISIVSILAFTNNLIAYPLPDSTTLPAPDNIDPEDKEKMLFILGLKVYRDHKKENQYYYIPPFRVYEFKEGAASVVPLASKVEAIYEAEQQLNNLDSIQDETFDSDPVVRYRTKVIADLQERLVTAGSRYNERIDYCRENIAQAKERIEYYQEKRIEASLEGREDIIATLDKWIKDKKEEIKEERAYIEGYEAEINNIKDDIKSNIDEKTAALNAIIEDYRAQLQKDEILKVISRVNTAGGNIDVTDYDDLAALRKIIQKEIDEQKKTYGGFLSINIYSGFTLKQVEGISELIYKYYPNLSVSLLHAEDFHFDALTEIVNNNGTQRNSAIFRKINGSGTYEGANLTMDLSLEGAYSLTSALGPFNLPIGISAKIKRKAVPFHARLSCDFTNYGRVHGRSDIRDGLIFFDNDISTDISKSTHNDGACDLEVYEGDVYSARIKAMEEIQRRLEEINFQQINLTQAETERYYRGVMYDLERNRRNSNIDESLPRYVMHLGSWGFVVGGLSMLTNYHWHTSKHNMHRLNNLRFQKTMKINGYEEHRQKIPTRLCLFFNPVKRAYDRCTETQEKSALSPSQAIKMARESCKEGSSVLECRKERSKNAPELRPEPEERVRDNYMLSL